MNVNSNDEDVCCSEVQTQMPLSANRQSARMRQRVGMCETQLPVRDCGVASLNRMLSNQQLRVGIRQLYLD